MIMSKSSKKNIVQGVFNRVLCYCLPLFGGCNISEVQSLQTRIVLNLPPRSSRQSMFDKLNWMTVNQLIAYHTLIAVFRIRNSQEPEHLASQLRNDNYRGNIIVKNSQLGLYKKSFVPRGSTLWNKLPEELKNSRKIGKFKMDLRKWVGVNVARFLD